MKKILKEILFNFQKILVLGLRYSFPLSTSSKLNGLVVGTETATILKSVAEILEFDSINLSNHRFYDFSYTFEPSKKNSFVSIIFRCYILARVVPKYNSITYVGSDGLIRFFNDGRYWEFDFIKSLGLKIICVYTGTDIRSFEKMKNLPRLKNMDTIATYHPCIMNCSMEIREKSIEKLSSTSDRFADLIFNYPVDQISYMKREVVYFPYMIPDSVFNFNKSSKWNNIDKLIVLHCPSSPIIKGTPIVRAAIKKLQTLGYDFEYIELIGVTHEKVLSELRRAHVVLNQFYSFVPSVFGMEALAANSVLLTSADKNIEPMLPEGANDAWIVTPYWEVFDNLKKILDLSVDKLQEQAEYGYRWAKLHGSYSQAKQYLESKYEHI